MIIYYTDREGGVWTPFDTAYTESQIRIELDDNIKYPSSIQKHNKLVGVLDLPEFHALLLPSSSRWDVFNRKWEVILDPSTQEPIFEWINQKYS